ncbi:uncharacterized protein LOC124437154 [Xenia sp. Carnegie-2017]|uniref:uncharacterized protein LOC124437154 n=1 Tax=Xenia sp. Carnegie-2017 TaxID=2897299 RepID=UPI001F039933|nr:uncharacterized protein LOC124437154 [Xenia sp. Carnegie-2017]
MFYLLELSWTLQTFLLVVCLFLTIGLLKSFTNHPVTIKCGRRLDYFERFLELSASTHDGKGNLSVNVTLASKHRLETQHVHDALVLLVKRQPMLRAVISTLPNGEQYFAIKETEEAIEMFDIQTSNVKICDWKRVIYEYTSKIRENSLCWRLVILQEEFDVTSGEYVNILLFAFKHACYDGISCIKFCKDFLNNMNEIASGIFDVEKEVESLELLPSTHDLVTRSRVWFALFHIVLSFPGLRLILNFLMKKLISYMLAKKKVNPFYAQHPPIKHTETSLEFLERVHVKTFNVEETRAIVDACRLNGCTVTGAITAAVHRAFYKMIGEKEEEFSNLESWFAVSSQRYCNPKPSEEYHGVFVYLMSCYMKYEGKGKSDFWTMAKESTAQIRQFVKDQQFVTEFAVLSNILDPADLSDMFSGETAVLKSSSYFISSFGSFDMKFPQASIYKLKDLYVHDLNPGSPILTRHYIHTIDGKMRWLITSDVTFDEIYSKQFNISCFDEIIQNCHVSKK